jgi:hypothetical protein
LDGFGLAMTTVATRASQRLPERVRYFTADGPSKDDVLSKTSPFVILGRAGRTPLWGGPDTFLSDVPHATKCNLYAVRGSTEHCKPYEKYVQGGLQAEESRRAYSTAVLTGQDAEAIVDKLDLCLPHLAKFGVKRTKRDLTVFLTEGQASASGTHTDETPSILHLGCGQKTIMLRGMHFTGIIACNQEPAGCCGEVPI